MTILSDILTRRGGPGNNPHWFTELYHGNHVICMNYAPDPMTFRDEYYYNTRQNKLYKKFIKAEGHYTWKDVINTP